MYEIKNLKDLENAITELEAKRDQDWMALKTQLSETLEELRPSNLLKNAVHDIIDSPDIQNSLIDNAIGISTGFLAKKLVFGGTGNPISRILGTILETAVSNRVSKHPEGIKSLGKTLFNKFFSNNGRHNENGHSAYNKGLNEDK
ncbi:MAG: hypothetical protein K0R65_1846 [Crocinitomicaceae bacterium]|jgi:hypothetical protein|nr:hypothetical protein [Crocinitomicaceae bacterium]